MRKLACAVALVAALVGVEASAQDTPRPVESPPAPPAQVQAAPEATPPPAAASPEAVTPPPAPPAVPAAESPDTQPPTPGNLVHVPKKDLPKDTFTTNPLNLLISTYSVEYERVVADGYSLFLSPGYFLPTTNLTTGPDEFGTTSHFLGSARGFGVNGGVRYFPAREAPRGLFIAPQLSYYTGTTRGMFTYEGPNAGPPRASSGTRIDYGAGVMAGYTVLVGNLFVVSGGLGMGVTYSRTDERVEGLDEDIQAKFDFAPLLHFNVGLAF